MSARTRQQASDPLKWIQRLVLTRNYYFSGHVRDRLDECLFEIEDIEASVLNGSLKKVQRDEQGESVDGKKYVVLGKSTNGLAFETVGKIIAFDDGEEYYFISAY